MELYSRMGQTRENYIVGQSFAVLWAVPKVSFELNALNYKCEMYNR